MAAVNHASGVGLRTLRGKALVTAALALMYAACAVAYVAWQRAGLGEATEALEAASQLQRSVAQARTALSDALEAADPAGPGPASTAAREALQTSVQQFDRVAAADPALAPVRRDLQHHIASLPVLPDPSDRARLNEALARTASALDDRHHALEREHESLARSARRHADAVTIQAVGLAIVGFFGFGTASAWFFARLTRDLTRLEDHARQIVRGGRGIELDVRRSDEVGRLMHAVNRMAADLDEHERRIEVDGERRSHQDKMLALGALAAGVAHEVNNPLAVVSSLAQELQARAAAAGDADLADRAQAILAHTHRASKVAGQLSELTAPQPADFDWIDLNAIVRHALRMQGYDRRYRHLTYEFDADPAMPAVCSSGNALQQVVMDLLSMASDAVAATSPPESRIRVESSAGPDRVGIVFRLPPVLTFERAATQRKLLLIRALVEPIGGRLAFGQDGGAEQQIKLTLPLQAEGLEGSTRCQS